MVEILIGSLLLLRGLYLASCQARRLIPYSLTDILPNHLFLLWTVQSSGLKFLTTSILPKYRGQLLPTILVHSLQGLFHCIQPTGNTASLYCNYSHLFEHPLFL